MAQEPDSYYEPVLMLNDLKQCKKTENEFWTLDIKAKYEDQIINKTITFKLVCIQGYIDQKPCDNVMILRDSTGKVKLTNCTNAVTDIYSISEGAYCSVDGALVNEKGLPEVSTYKITKIDDSDKNLYYKFWPVQVKDFKFFALGIIKPNLNHK